MNKYQDIMNLPSYISKKYPRMTMNNRAAQFMPFAALTGYEDAVIEAGRLTSRKLELSEDEQDIINRKIQVIKEKIEKKIKVKITYFIEDKYKVGGEYQNIENFVKRIDETNQIMIMDDKTKILMNSIIDIEFI